MIACISLVAVASAASLVSQDGVAGLPFGSATYEMPADGEPARAPFRFAGGKVRLDAMVNGEGPFHLVLDTGMPTPGIVLFRSPRVDALGLADSSARVRMTGGGGEGASYDAVVAEGTSVTLGNLTMTQVAAMLLPPQQNFPQDMDGIIGGALFYRFAVRVDVDASHIELIEPDDFAPPEGAAVIPLIKVPGGAFVDVGIAIGEGRVVPARVVVDLGAGHAISLNSRTDGSLAPPPNAIDGPIGCGLSGVLLGKFGRLRRLEIGPFALEDVIATFPIEEHKHPGSFDFRDGNLGAGILKRFVATFDYAHDRLILEPGARYADSFEHDMSGLSLVWQRDGTVRVLAVLEDSPGDAAGIEKDDQLVAIDGRPVGELGADGARRVLTVHDAEVALTLKREKSTVEASIRLRRLL